MYANNGTGIKIFLVILVALAFFFIGRYASVNPVETTVTGNSTIKLVDKAPTNAANSVDQDYVATHNSVDVFIPEGYGYIEYADSSVPCFFLTKDQNPVAIVVHTDTKILTNSADFNEAIGNAATAIFGKNLLTYDKQSLLDEDTKTVMALHDVAGNLLVNIAKLADKGLTSILLLEPANSEHTIVSKFLELNGASESFYSTVDKQLAEMESE